MLHNREVSHMHTCPQTPSASPAFHTRTHMATSAICLRQQLQKFSFDLWPLLFVYPLKQDMLKSIPGGRSSLLIWILEKTDAAKPFRGRKLVTRVWAPEAPALDSKPDCLWDARQALASPSSHQEHRPIGSWGPRVMSPIHINTEQPLMAHSFFFPWWRWSPPGWPSNLQLLEEILEGLDCELRGHTVLSCKASTSWLIETDARCVDKTYDLEILWV